MHLRRVPFFLVAVLALAIAGAANCRRSAAPPSASGFNLLLVTLDTLRADHLGAWGYTQGSTPTLDRLADEGVRLAVATAPAPLTLPAHATLLTGLLPTRHRLHVNGVGALSKDVPTLATQLSAAGYRTAAFVGAFVLDHRFGLARGFDVYDDDIPRDGPESLESERPGRVVVDRALAWLRNRDPKPFFAWVHLYDAHAPYAPPEPFASRFASRLYDGEIAEVDAQVGRLLAELAELGVADRTVVAIVGDHGEALGEHGELTHGLLLYQASLHVPLIFRSPAALPARVALKQPVGTVDLAPTLAGLLGRPFAVPVDHPLDGRDLSDDLRHGREPPAEEVYAESEYAASFGWSPLRALRSGPWKYILAPRPELYDLAHDPGETTNLAEAQPSRTNQLAARLDRVAPATSAAQPVAVDEETRARLASLGYLAGARLGHAGPGRDPKDVIGLFRGFEEAHGALVRHELGTAHREFESLVASDPDNAVFIGQLAETCRRQGDRDRAVQLYRRAIQVSPQDREARYNLAVTLQEVGRTREAITALADAIRLDPGRPEAHNALGIALSLSGDRQEALREFTNVVDLEPRNARAFNNLGNALRDLGRLDEGERAYRRAIELLPDYADPYNGLATLEVKRDRPAAAVPLFERAIALSPERLEVRLNRAIALQLAGQRQAAIAGYRDFLARAASNREQNQGVAAARQLLAQLERPRAST